MVMQLILNLQLVFATLVLAFDVAVLPQLLQMQVQDPCFEVASLWGPAVWVLFAEYVTPEISAAYQKALAVNTLRPTTWPCRNLRQAHQLCAR